MKALVKFSKGPGNVEIREVEEPVFGPDQVKLEVAWCGLCGTDLHVYHDTFRNFPPVILGHEIVAVVVENRQKGKGFSAREKICVLGASPITFGGGLYFPRRGIIFFSARPGAAWATE